MSPSGIELVCFDLGRVLIPICDSWDQACRLTGVSMPKALRDPEVLKRASELVEQHETGRIDADMFDREAAALSGLTARQVALLSVAWIFRPYPGVAALIDRVVATGVRTACLTNTNDRHWEILNGDLPLDRLDYRFASHLLGAVKPQPKPYEQVESDTRIPPHAILYFDDHPPNVETARRRGWQSVRIDPSGNTVEQMTSHLRRKAVL